MAFSDLLRLGGEQHGYFRTDQAEALGMSRRALSHRASIGELDHQAYGLWRLSAWPAGPRDELYALSAIAPQATFSHDTALSLLGLGDFIPTEIHLTIPESSRLQPRPGIRIHRSRSGAELDRLRRDGLFISTPRRALLDAARSGLEPALLQTAASEALSRGLLSSADQAELRRLPLFAAAL
jgi:predicted transcriptional regulator of viral defense system